MKTLIICILLFVITIGTLAFVRQRHPSDAVLREAVVQLLSEHGGCTGIQVTAPSGTQYVLTAAHCRPLLDENNHVTAVSEHGFKDTLTFVQEDDKSDLMLLTGSPKFGAVSVATIAPRLHEHVHSLTHGGLAPTYRTDGEMLDSVPGGFLISEVENEEDAKKCEAMPKYRVIDILFGKACALDVLTSRTTAQIIPGSSGGPLFNDSGDLVGIASYGNPQQLTFGYFVRQADIQEFLKAK